MRWLSRRVNSCLTKTMLYGQDVCVQTAVSVHVYLKVVGGDGSPCPVMRGA